MAIVTLKKLYSEGRLSLGDILEHSELGDFEVIRVYPDSTLLVKSLITKEYRNFDLGLKLQGATFQAVKHSYGSN
jgi:hypothetical protein